eukprot:8356097-Alexandrium_andersonii.AAC.1
MGSPLLPIARPVARCSGTAVCRSAIAPVAFGYNRGYGFSPKMVIRDTKCLGTVRVRPSPTSRA